MSEEQIIPRDLQAVVHFWDHYEVSPAVELPDIGLALRQELVSFRVYVAVRLARVGLGWPPPPSIASALFCGLMLRRGHEARLRNAPLGPSLGVTLSRIHSPEQSAGGAGVLLVDLGMNEVQIYGGYGFGDADFNRWQVRAQPLVTDAEAAQQIELAGQMGEEPDWISGDTAEAPTPPDQLPANGVAVKADEAGDRWDVTCVCGHTSRYPRSQFLPCKGACNRGICVAKTGKVRITAPNPEKYALDGTGGESVETPL